MNASGGRIVDNLEPNFPCSVAAAKQLLCVWPQGGSSRPRGSVHSERRELLPQY